MSFPQEIVEGYFLLARPVYIRDPENVLPFTCKHLEAWTCKLLA